MQMLPILVIDYKSSDTSLKNYDQWEKEKALQLGLYSMALEQGATPLPQGEVLGAFYYSAKTMNREKGFRLEEGVGHLFSEHKKSQIQAETKKELYKSLNKMVAESIHQMLSGEFPAKPDDKKNCETCPWDQICRAPHLNS